MSIVTDFKSKSSGGDILLAKALDCKYAVPNRIGDEL